MKIRHWFGLIWELPQTLLGGAYFVVHQATNQIVVVERKENRWLVEIKGDGAVSLGYFVFHSQRDNAFVPVGSENRNHEWGHSIQSRRFGPLYLVVVGVPSVMRVLYALIYRIFAKKRWPHYYDGWPENAADRLGKVDRTLRPPP